MLDSLDMWLEEIGETLSNRAKGVGKGTCTSLVIGVNIESVSEKFGQLRDELGLNCVTR